MKSDFLVPILLHPAMGMKTLTTKGLLDSGCTSSAINKCFVDEHQLETHKTAVLIHVYNANGTCIAGGDITKFAEVRMMIGRHTERIDLAITNLGKRDVYLGHDWLKRHNPSVNWKTQSILFGAARAQATDSHYPTQIPTTNGMRNSKKAIPFLPCRWRRNS